MKQTIAQVFFKDTLIFKKENNINPLKIFYGLTLPFMLNSSKWKALYWVGFYVNCFIYFNFLLQLTTFLGRTVWKLSKCKDFSCSNTGKYGPEKTPSLVTFHAVKISYFRQKYYIGYVGPTIRVGTVLNQEGSNCKKRKWHVNLDSISFQGKSHKNYN